MPFLINCFWLLFISMADVYPKEVRSKVMSLIKSKNTKFEEKVFRFLRKQNLYFKKHYKRVPGSPDIALPRKKRAVFLDGDFWHGYKFKEKESKLPEYYWRDKIRRNINRDRENRNGLKNSGWEVLRVWEHQLQKSEQRFLKRIYAFLTQD